MDRITGRLLSWASMLEEATAEQARRTAGMPFINPHVALMPDAHLGLGATVGSVIPTLGAVMPAAVGVDIGCGMTAVRTGFDRTALEAPPSGRTLRGLRESIERAVPLSAGAANRTLTATAAARIEELETMAVEAGFDPAERAARWREQLGTLGSGNHFIEVSVDETDRVWLFLHSGSRGVGNRIATHHIRIAQETMRRFWIDLPDRDLAYLVEGTAEFDRYIAELRWAQHYARLNRDEMMDRVSAALASHMGEPVDEVERISCHPPLRRARRSGPTPRPRSSTSASGCGCRGRGRSRHAPVSPA